MPATIEPQLQSCRTFIAGTARSYGVIVLNLMTVIQRVETRKYTLFSVGRAVSAVCDCSGAHGTPLGNSQKINNHILQS